MYTNVSRALLEAWAAQAWKLRTGVLLWKSQNPWTGLRGQLYDCLLGPTGGFYGAAVALRPLHVLLDPLTLKVCPAQGQDPKNGCGGQQTYQHPGLILRKCQSCGCTQP